MIEQPVLLPQKVRLTGFASLLDSYYLTGTAGENYYLAAFTEVPDLPIRDATVVCYGRNMVNGSSGGSAPNIDTNGYVQFELVIPSAPGGADSDMLVAAGTQRFSSFTKFAREPFEFRTGFVSYGDPIFVRVTFAKHDTTKTSVWAGVEEVLVSMRLEVPLVIEPHLIPTAVPDFETASTR